MTASYDDWMHGLSARFSPRSIFPERACAVDVEDELDEVRDWGAMVTTVLHPQVSGRPMRFPPVARVPDLREVVARTSGSPPAPRSPPNYQRHEATEAKDA